MIGFDDAVDLSNLQRQVIHVTRHVGKPKVRSAAEKIAQLNPDVTVRQYHEFLAAENILDVIDGTDSFGTKFIINDASVIAGKPFSCGGILGFRGQTMTVLPGRSACCRCMFGAPPPPGTAPTCSQAGMLAAIQATETLKFVTGVGAPLADALLTFDALDMNFRKVPLKRNLACPVLRGAHPTILAPEDAPAEVRDLAGAHR